MQRNGLNLHLYIHIMFAPKPTLSEKELIEACQKHNRSAQRQLYERYSARMFAVCLKYARSVEVAKDYLQDGFATVFLKIGTYTGEGVFEGWMRKIFVNTALMDLRRMDVLKEAQDIDLKRGWYAAKGIIATDIIEQLLSVCRAPVIIEEGV